MNRGPVKEALHMYPDYKIKVIKSASPWMICARKEWVLAAWLGSWNGNSSETSRKESEFTTHFHFKRKEMTTVPGSLVWELVKKNNCFLIKQFGNNNIKVQFSKEPNNLYNVHSYKFSGP
ncbi:hypothetical protein QYE76_058927 [Lolium multiflorum]|uniref:Ribosomal eL28/Mak16 domain-containing protein n=1 Tax=Lolium multiflorum TaxID=4521 RepID=A0AAD8T6F0_LOLMU|nr:hypothetical protein QYE76_058927 [Lolium multiflorum]